MTTAANGPARSPKEGAVVRQLGDGLVLRRGRVEDTEALAEFTAMHVGPEAPDEGIRHWTRDLMKGDLPGFGPAGLHDSRGYRTGAIVATLNLISQTWSYEGVEFPVGRIELVGTTFRLPAARADACAARDRPRVERGARRAGPGHHRHPVVLPPVRLRDDDGAHGRPDVAAEDVPGLRPGEVEPYTLREATDDDVSFLTKTYTTLDRAASSSPASETRRCGDTSCSGGAKAPCSGSTRSSSSPRTGARPGMCS